MVFAVLVAQTPALDNFQFGNRYLYGFNAFAVNGCRKDKGVFFGRIATYTMVHRLSLCYYFLYAFKYTDTDTPIGKYKSEELGFNRLKFGFLFKLLFQLRLCIALVFFRI